MKSFEPYKPKEWLKGAYAEATLLNDEGLQALCPSYTELSEADIRFQDGVLLGKGAVKEVYKTLNNHTKRWVAMARLRADRGPEFYDLFVHFVYFNFSGGNYQPGLGRRRLPHLSSVPRIGEA